MVTKNLRGLAGEKLDNGKYIIVKPLDEGGMGAVWTAKSVSMDTEVVIKFPLAEFLHEDGFRERFENEIRSLISLCSRHTNIVNILDVGVYEDIPYAVMQYLTGGNLKDWTTRLTKYPKKESIEWTRVLKWIDGIADALDFVHRNQVIHRDIKPANILFDEGRNAYIADFGISKSLGKEGPTKVNQVVGTLSYMAPEVLLGESATHLSDQYAFAATLYKALTGEVPFSGATESLLHHNQQSPPRRLETWGYLPSRLTPVVFKALNFDPSKRFGSCAEFASEVLRSFAAPAAAPKPRPTPQPQPVEDPATKDTKRNAPVAEDTSRNMPDAKSGTQRPVVPVEIVTPPHPGSGAQVGSRPADPNATIVKQPTTGATNTAQRPTSAGSGSTSTIATARNQRRLSCPWCWHAFSLAELLWISEHADIEFDDKLGGEHLQRFLPEVFTPDCQAIDVLGSVCERTACPNCHLEIPRDSIENDAVYLSVVGAASSGKSCYLSSLVHKLRQTFPQKFELSFSDADPELNGSLIKNEQLLFNNRSSKPVKIDKTFEQGTENYRNVNIDGVDVQLVRPSIFTMKPTPSHPNYSFSSAISYSLCLYDNAGEHFSPGKDKNKAPVTRHLGLSDATVFIFDPTQHIGFRKVCAKQSTDPQFSSTDTSGDPQDTVLTETMRRIRNSTKQSTYKYEKPLIVVVNKFDAWASVFSLSRLAEPWVSTRPNFPYSLHLPRIHQVSGQIRQIMQAHAPEFVATAETLCSNVIFIPVSSFGRRAGKDNMVLANELNPMWVEVPVLYAFAAARKGVIHRILPQNG